MPKAKTKKSRKDFQKVKLKVGKKLSKGDNVTNLSFKTKQIQLSQRIRDGDGNEPVSKRNKLTVQDLLRQCDHYGSAARVNAVAGLKEIWLDNHQELMQPSNKYGYGSIIQKLSTMFIDNEAVVRHSVINFFKMIINRVSKGHGQIPKGFPMLHIHTYLCCALSNIHEDIKLDGLLIFDVLLDFFPKLLVEQTGDLLNSLLSFISAPMSIGDTATSTTQKLSLNPDSKLPVMQFRSKVLSRIKRLFQMSVNAQTEEKTDDSCIKENESSNVWSQGGDCQDTVIRSQQSHNKFKTLFSGSCHEIDNYLTKPATLEFFVTNSINVLLQCWKEARASIDSQSNSGSGIVSRDSAEVMTQVVTIIQLAFNLCGTRRLKANNSVSGSDTLVSADILVLHHAAEFEKVFMSNFPYSVQVAAPSGKKRKRKHPDTENHSQTVQISVENLNFGLCDIMCSFLTSKQFKPQQSWCVKLQTFLKNHLVKGLSGTQCSTIARCLKNILSAPSSMKPFVPCFGAALDYYMTCSVMMSQKRVIFDILSSVCTLWKRQESDSPQKKTSLTKLIVRICSGLPHLLHNVIRKKKDVDWALNILSLMKTVRAQNLVEFSEKFLQLLSHYLDAQKGILGCSSDLVVQQVFFIMSMGTPLTKQHYRLVLHLLRSTSNCMKSEQLTNCNTVPFIIKSLYQNIHLLVPLTNQIEFNKLTTVEECHLSEFLSFMLSLQIGMLKEELDESSPVCPGNSAKDSKQLWEIDMSCGLDKWSRHVQISQEAAMTLANFRIPACPEEGYKKSFCFTATVEQMWMKTFTDRCKMHIFTVYSLLDYMNLLTKQHVPDKPSEDFQKFTSWIIASFLVHIHVKDTDLSDIKLMVWKIKDILLKTLTNSKDLLKFSWSFLNEMSSRSEYAESSATAKELLLSDASIKRELEKLQ